MMRRFVLLGLLLGLVTSAGEGAGPRRMLVVADLPYARVWQAALRAVADYPIERAADRVIVTGWRERPPTATEVGFDRVQERVTLRVEPFAEQITRISADAEAQGWRDGQWVPIGDTDAIVGKILARVREAQG
jgi:hypothetical protein